MQKHTQSPAAPHSLPPFLRIPRPGLGGPLTPGGPRSPRFGGPPRSPFRPGMPRPGSFKGRPPFPFRPGMPPPGGPYRGASPPPGMVRKASLVDGSPGGQSPMSMFEKVPQRRASQALPTLGEQAYDEPTSMFDKVPTRRASQAPSQALPALGEQPYGEQPYREQSYGEQPYTPPSLHSESPTAPLAPAYSFEGEPQAPQAPSYSFDGEPQPHNQLQQQGCTTTFDQGGQLSASMDHADLDADLPGLEWSSQNRMGGYCDSPGTASLASTTNLDNTDNYHENNLRQNLHQQQQATSSLQTQSQSSPPHLHNDILLQADQTAGSSSSWVTRYFLYHLTDLIRYLFATSSCTAVSVLDFVCQMLHIYFFYVFLFAFS